MSLYHAPLPLSLPGWPGAPVHVDAAEMPIEANLTHIRPQSTPIKDNFATQSAFTTEQFKAATVRKMLAQELADAVFCNIHFVWEKYLAASTDILSHMQRRQLARRLVENVPGWPHPPSFKDRLFVAWLVNTLNECASLAQTMPLPAGPAPTPTPCISEPQYHWLNSQSKAFSGASSTHRSPDFVLVSTRYSLEDITWASIHVVGEHQSAGSSETQCILQLADYASQIFAHQVTRIFVHAILTLNTAPAVKLLVFDRAGAVVSTTQTLQDKLPDIAVAYASMSRARLGYDTQALIASEDLNGSQKLSVVLPSGRKAVLQRVLCRRPGIITRGTFCAVAIPKPRTQEVDTTTNLGAPSVGTTTDLSAIGRPTDLSAVVVKLSWRAASRKSEGELLKTAAQRNVICIAQYISHQDLGDIALLRKGINATGPALQFPDPNSQPPSRGGSSRGSSGTRALRLPTSLTGSSGLQSVPEGSLVASLAVMEIAPQPSPYQARLHQLNRIHTLIVTGPVGTPITECTSAVQVAQTLLGALIGHASLFFRGGILHRDISINNIMYTAAAFPVSPADRALHAAFLPAAAPPLDLHGFLIDLDYAIVHPSLAASGAPHRTGTLPFMSINVLFDCPHTYSDDLESFLYVLVWTCIISAEGRVAPGSLLWNWADGRREQLRSCKYHHMNNARQFEKLLGEFRPEYVGLRGLARRWRGLLFGGERGGPPGARAEDGVSPVPDWDAFVQARDACWEELQGIGMGGGSRLL